jgi:hypothetical protein
VTRSGDERTWVIVGKISVIVTIVGTLIGVVVSLRHPGPHLTVTCSYSSYSLPPDLTYALDANRRCQSLDSLLSIVKRSIAGQEPKGEIDAFDVSRAVGKMLDASWPKEYQYRTDLYSEYWHFDVRNTGDLPAADVVLDVPARGVGLLTPDSGDPQVVICNGSIALGVIRPGNSLQLGVWSAYPVGGIGKQDVRLTSSSGVGSVRYERRLVGWRIWVAEHLGSLLFTVLLLAMALTGIAGLYKGWSGPTHHASSEGQAGNGDKAS